MLHPKGLWFNFHCQPDCKAERHIPFHLSKQKLQNPRNKYYVEGELFPWEICRRILARERNWPLKPKLFQSRQQGE